MHELRPATLFLQRDLADSTQHTSGLLHTSKSSYFDLLVPSHFLFTHSFSPLQADNIYFEKLGRQFLTQVSNQNAPIYKIFSTNFNFTEILTLTAHEFCKGKILTKLLFSG